MDKSPSDDVLSYREKQNNAIFSKLVLVVLACIRFWNFVLSKSCSECQCESYSGGNESKTQAMHESLFH